MKIVLSSNPFRDKNLKAARSADRILRASGAETKLCLPFTFEGANTLELPKEVAFCDLKKELEN